MRGKPCEFRRAVNIAAPIEQVFAFHANPDNIPKISPSWQSIRVHRGGPAITGNEFDIKVRFFSVLPLHWRGVWREVDTPNLLVDEALQSPFAFWRHRHAFERIDAHTTRMVDHVTYAVCRKLAGKALWRNRGTIPIRADVRRSAGPHPALPGVRSALRRNQLLAGARTLSWPTRKENRYANCNDRSR